MIELNSALGILMAEGLGAMILLALGLFFMARNRRGKEMADIESFVSRLGEEEALKSRLLETILVENCGIDNETAAAVMQEVSSAERALLQRVVQMFLQRDPSLLAEIDQLIANLSDPYCKLLADSAGGAVSGDASEAKTGKKNAGLERVNQQLVRQLDTAMKTIDEITAEYTRVFSGNQTALELENSSKKMMQIFQDTEKRIQNNAADIGNLEP